MLAPDLPPHDEIDPELLLCLSLFTLSLALWWAGIALGWVSPPTF